MKRRVSDVGESEYLFIPKQLIKSQYCGDYRIIFYILNHLGQIFRPISIVYPFYQTLQMSFCGMWKQLEGDSSYAQQIWLTRPEISSNNTQSSRYMQSLFTYECIRFGSFIDQDDLFNFVKNVKQRERQWNM